MILGSLDNVQTMSERAFAHHYQPKLNKLLIFSDKLTLIAFRTR